MISKEERRRRRTEKPNWIIPPEHPDKCVPMDYPEMAVSLREHIMKWGSISKLARETGYSRGGISRALRPNGNMRFNMFWDITLKVGFHWCIGVRGEQCSHDVTHV